MVSDLEQIKLQLRQLKSNGSDGSPCTEKDDEDIEDVEDIELKKVFHSLLPVPSFDHLIFHNLFDYFLFLVFNFFNIYYYQF